VKDPSAKTWAATINDGTKAAWPICLGYIPVGIAFGVIAQKTGLTLLEIALMSCLVFAGSSQFIAVSMIGSGAGLIPIIITTFTVNLRHLLMSSALAVHLRLTDRRMIALFSYGVTDESFALNLGRFRMGEWTWREALAVNHVANAVWIISTVAGGYAGSLIPPGAFGIDYALAAMLLSLLIFQLRSLLYVAVAAFSGVLAVVLALTLPGNLYMVIAPIAAASAGLLAAMRWREREEP
jgi:4-azaleucine resistance transporter AzlC